MEQPIQALMKTTLENIRGMIDVNTVIGEPVETLDGTVIIPISKVGFGFISGGGDLKISSSNDNGDDNTDLESNQAAPFTGGSGAGVSVQPVGFLSVSHGQIRMIPVNCNTVIDRVIDLIPKLMDNIGKKDGRKEGV